MQQCTVAIACQTGNDGKEVHSLHAVVVLAREPNVTGKLTAKAGAAAPACRAPATLPAVGREVEHIMGTLPHAESPISVLYTGVLQAPATGHSDGKVSKLRAKAAARGVPAAMHTRRLPPGTRLADGSTPAAVAVVAMRKSVVIVALPSARVVTVPHSKPITAVALCPRSVQLGAGDIEGQILTWALADLLAADAKGHPLPKPSVAHWHANAVSALCYSSDNAYLLSGGEEGVLVQWARGTGVPSFLPRLGAPIRQLSVSDAHATGLAQGSGAVPPPMYAVSLANNALLFVEASTLSLQGALRLPSACARFMPHRALLADASSGCVAVLGYGPTPAVQWLHPSTAQSAAELAIAPLNVTSRADVGEPVPTVLHHAALSAQGNTLATVHALAAAGNRNTELRFWARENVSPPAWKLATSVPSPAGGSVPTALCVSPDGTLAATATATGEWTLWEAQLGATGSHGQAGLPCWSALGVASWRALPVTAMAASHDGTALAVAYGSAITVWDMRGLRLLQVLCAPGCALDAGQSQVGAVQHLAWLAGTSQLVSGSSAELRVWDIASGKCLWGYGAHVVHLAAAGPGGFVAAVAASENSGVSRKDARRALATVKASMTTTEALVQELLATQAVPASAPLVAHWHAGSPVPRMVWALPATVPVVAVAAHVAGGENCAVTALTAEGGIIALREDAELQAQARSSESLAKAVLGRVHAMSTAAALASSKSLAGAASSAGSLDASLRAATASKHLADLYLGLVPHALPRAEKLLEAALSVCLPAPVAAQDEPAASLFQPQPGSSAAAASGPAVPDAAAPRTTALDGSRSAGRLAGTNASPASLTSTAAFFAEVFGQDLAKRMSQAGNKRRRSVAPATPSKQMAAEAPASIADKAKPAERSATSSTVKRSRGKKSAPAPAPAPAAAPKSRTRSASCASAASGTSSTRASTRRTRRA